MILSGLRHSFECDALAQVAQSSGFQATWRTRFDLATPIGSDEIDRAWILAGHRDIERSATVTIVLDKAEKRRSLEHDREAT